MSGIQTREVVLRIRPGESVSAFARRIAASAPPAPVHVMDQLRTLLVPATPDVVSPPARRLHAA
ncbi:hypothetical protein PV413_03570 [Streptomyces scabiei]|uniref:hypothetical protein n=1 Tax=Streptomyces scabiei TaxID=1930 RepID=UPI001B315051|nr:MULTISPECIES: hypothetical protein [Streptomyces]MDX2749579.1 hypothetical protein [Streptomyces scabiei]MDX3026787.1 hypothetical protein [Streptomyces scabiei]MDX3146553.1 hypothetical protein [Streptomyces scabiei]MDX3196959.1 hypothetical protein [Streptomyces scabiei]MDX3212078.1 hypothetical protein [Streptomyces scabiei]